MAHTQVRKSIREVRNGLVDLLDKFPQDNGEGLLKKALQSSQPCKSLREQLRTSKVTGYTAQPDHGGHGEGHQAIVT